MTRRSIYSRKLSPLDKTKRGLKRRWRDFSKLSKKKKAMIVASPFVAFLIIVPAVTYLYYYHDISDMNRLINANNTGVTLLDDTGKSFYSIGTKGANEKLVPIDKISKDMQHALISSEDKNFYTNDGFSIRGILRAVYDNVVSHSISGGGSTITQQLAKNTLLSDKRTLLRKYQELTIAVAIDHRYSKDQILDMYLNSVFFGGTNFGVKDAAKFYFNKSPQQLDLAESAMLVGILPAPNAYSPTLGSMKYAKERQSYVLDRMHANGYITSSQEMAASKEKLHFAKPTTTESTVAPAFVGMVMDQLDQKYGQEKVLRSGMRVKTTLNVKMQKELASSIAQHIPYINAQGGTNAASVAVDPSTGEIRALVGSADYNNKKWGKVNMAITPRQPGSSFKTIYYTGALANGTINPATILKDEPVDFGGGYKPHDADMQWRGQVTVRRAISQSLNIPSIEVMQKYGIDNAIQTAKDLGITTIDSSKNYGLPLALGSAEVPLNEMVGAYATIANGGTKYDQTSIDSINDKFGKTIFTSTDTSQRVVSAQASYLISNILSDYGARAPVFGNTLTVPGYTTAVKTGTTNDDRDAWTIGYTPKIAVGVWVGNNDNTAMQDGGSDMAGPMWAAAMSQFLAGTKDIGFTAPSGVVERNVCQGTDNLAPQSGINTYQEYFMAQYTPSGTCAAEQKPVMIEVCDLADKKMIKINKDDYDSQRYSKNPDDCKKPKTIEVCDLSTGQVVTINESDYDSNKYSKDTSNCSPPMNGTPPTTGPVGPVIPPPPADGSGSGNGNGNGNGGGQPPGN